MYATWLVSLFHMTMAVNFSHFISICQNQYIKLYFTKAVKLLEYQSFGWAFSLLYCTVLHDFLFLPYNQLFTSLFHIKTDTQRLKLSQASFPSILIMSFSVVYEFSDFVDFYVSLDIDACLYCHFIYVSGLDCHKWQLFLIYLQFLPDLFFQLLQFNFLELDKVSLNICIGSLHFQTIILKQVEKIQILLPIIFRPVTWFFVNPEIFQNLLLICNPLGLISIFEQDMTKEVIISFDCFQQITHFLRMRIHTEIQADISDQSSHQLSNTLKFYYCPPWFNFLFRYYLWLLWLETCKVFVMLCQVQYLSVQPINFSFSYSLPRSTVSKKQFKFVTVVTWKICTFCSFYFLRSYFLLFQRNFRNICLSYVVVFLICIIMIRMISLQKFRICTFNFRVFHLLYSIFQLLLIDSAPILQRCVMQRKVGFCQTVRQEH